MKIPRTIGIGIAADHIRENPGAQVFLQRHGRSRQQSCADDVKKGHEDQGTHRDHKEHDQGLNATAGDHAIEDLEHEQGRYQHQ